MRREKFLNICAEENASEHERTGIGTYMEKRLHIVLKRYMDDDPSHHEFPLLGFVADIFDGDTITEIQTGSLRPLYKKIKRYIEKTDYNVVVVCPIAKEKWVSWIDVDTGETSKKRKSPKTGRASDILPELYYLREFIPGGHLTLRLVMLKTEEYRMLNGWSRDKKKGSSRYERIPTDILEEIEFRFPRDYAALIPKELGDKFTSADFARVARLSKRKTSFSLGTLCALSLLERCGKDGNAYIYGRIQ